MECSKPAATKMATGPMITATLPDSVLANVAINTARQTSMFARTPDVSVARADLSSFESIVASTASPIVHAASDRHLFRCDGLDSIRCLISCYDRVSLEGGTWADTGIPFGRALSRRMISALCASVRELYRQASSARITGRALREDDARQEQPLFHGPRPVRYEHSCCGHRLPGSHAFVLAQPVRDDRQLFQSQSSTPRPNPTIYSLTNIRERHAEVPCHRIFQ